MAYQMSCHMKGCASQFASTLTQGMDRAVASLAGRDGISLRQLRVHLQESMGVDLASQKAAIRRMAEQTVEDMTSGLKVSSLPTDCLAQMRSPWIGEWEPCARIVDGSIAVEGRERGRQLFTPLHDMGICYPCFVVSGHCAVDKCELRDENTSPRDRHFLIFAINELEDGRAMRNSIQKENPPQAAHKLCRHAFGLWPGALGPQSPEAKNSSFRTVVA